MSFALHSSSAQWPDNLNWKLFDQVTICDGQNLFIQAICYVVITSTFEESVSISVLSLQVTETSSEYFKQKKHFVERI